MLSRQLKQPYRLLVLAVMTVATLVAVPTLAASSEESVQSLASTVVVQPNNQLDITEAVVYNFGASSHHGIYRNIPTTYQDPNGHSYYLGFNYLKTLDEAGKTVPSQITKADGVASIRLGDANKTVSGIHTYNIHYQLSPVVNQKDGLPHLALDVIGTGWDVPVEASRGTISLQNGAVWTNATCFVGTAGSTTTCPVSLAGSTATITLDQPLGAHEGVTFEANLPTGYVDHYLVADQKPPLTAGEIWGMIIMVSLMGLVILAGIVTGIIFIIRARRQAERRRTHTVVAQYEAPDGLTAGEIGYLHDNTANTIEVTATLIDLAVRGYIKIIQTKPKSIFSKAKYDLQKLRDYADVQNYEQTLLDAVFAGGDQVAVSDLDQTKMANAVSSIREALKHRLQKRGYYGTMKAQKGLINKLLEGGNISPEGGQEWAKVEGLKLYLEVAEKDRLNFSDAPEKTPERFNKLLPYAVALGVEKQWAKQFEGIDVSSSNHWYVGSPGVNFTAFALASDMNSSFAGAINSNFVASSGGGGSSGGGFGGGGGGSW